MNGIASNTDLTIKSVLGHIGHAAGHAAEGNIPAIAASLRTAFAALDTIGESAVTAPSPVLPLGYETPFDYLTREAPAIFDLLGDETGDTLADDEARLVQLCAAKGVPSVSVELSPTARRVAGRDTAIAFPVFVLRDHYTT